MGSLRRRTLRSSALGNRACRGLRGPGRCHAGTALRRYSDGVRSRRSLRRRHAMTEYIVKIGFWLRAYDGIAVEADSDADAIEKAKAAAKAAMESGAYPE